MSQLHLSTSGAGARQRRLVEALLERQARCLRWGRRQQPLAAVRLDGCLLVDNVMVNPYSLVLRRPNWLRIDAGLAGGIYSRGYDGTAAWVRPPGRGPAQPLSGELAHALRRAAEWPSPVCSLQDFRARGHSVELLGRVEDDGAHYVLRLAHADGTLRDYWMDARSALLRYAREVRPARAGQPEQVREIFWEDFRRVGGHRLAFGEWERDPASGAVLRNITWRSITLNPAS